MRQKTQALKQISQRGGIGAILVSLCVILIVVISVSYEYEIVIIDEIIDVGAILSIGLSVIGIVLLAIAFYQLAKFVNNKSIFNNFLRGIVMGILSPVIATLFFHLVFSPEDEFEATALSYLVWWMLGIISASFCSESYKLVGRYFNNFELAANFLWWGAITAIVGVGFILMLISNILLARAFFSLPENFQEEQNK